MSPISARSLMIQQVMNTKDADAKTFSSLRRGPTVCGLAWTG